MLPDEHRFYQIFMYLYQIHVYLPSHQQIHVCVNIYIKKQTPLIQIDKTSNVPYFSDD